MKKKKNKKCNQRTEISLNLVSRLFVRVEFMLKSLLQLTHPAQPTGIDFLDVSGFPCRD